MPKVACLGKSSACSEDVKSYKAFSAVDLEKSASVGFTRLSIDVMCKLNDEEFFVTCLLTYSTRAASQAKRCIGLAGAAVDDEDKEEQEELGAAELTELTVVEALLAAGGALTTETGALPRYKLR